MKAMVFFTMMFLLFAGEADGKTRKRRGKGKAVSVAKKMSLRQRLAKPNLTEAELRQKLALELIDTRKERDVAETKVNFAQMELCAADKELKKIPAKEALIVRLEQDSAAYIRRAKWIAVLPLLTALLSWLTARWWYRPRLENKAEAKEPASLPENATQSAG